MTQFQGDMNRGHSLSTEACVLLAASGACLVLVSLWTRAEHDYFLYVLHWQKVLAGDNPWASVGDTGNTYGPLHLVFAFPASIHYLLPKLIFQLSWIYACYVLGREMTTRRASSIIGLSWVLLNPLTLFFVGVYGVNDAVVAMLCFCSLVSVNDERPREAGLLLGLAILLKIYPVVFLPALAIHRGRISWTFGLVAVLTTVVGLILPVVVWGPSVVNTVAFAAERSPKMLSIFAFLRDSRLSPTAQDLTWMSLPLMGVSQLALAVVHLASRSDRTTAMLLAFVVCFAFYQVGHPQFWLVSLLLYPYWLSQRAQSFSLRRDLAPVCYFSVLLAFSAWYGVSDGSMKFKEVRNTVGLPMFLCAVAFAVRLLGGLRRGDVSPENDGTRN